MTESKVSEIKSFVTPAEMARELERELRPHLTKMVQDSLSIPMLAEMLSTGQRAQIVGLEKKVKELRTREADAKREAARADRLARDVAEKDREIARLRVELDTFANSPTLTAEELDKARGELAAERQTSGGLRLQLDQVRRELNAANGIASNGTTADTWKREADRANQSNRELTERCEALSAQIRKVERDADRKVREAQAGEQAAKIALERAQAWEAGIRFANGIVAFIQRWKTGHVSGETHARDLERWMTEAGIAMVPRRHVG